MSAVRGLKPTATIVVSLCETEENGFLKTTMSAHNRPAAELPLDLSRWRNAPTILMLVGGALAVLGWALDAKQFGYSWLFAYMFFLSFCLGALFLVMVHHLFDASWSVPIRRYVEHMACLAPVMAALFVPIAILAPRIYEWMHRLQTGEIQIAVYQGECARIGCLGAQRRARGVGAVDGTDRGEPAPDNAQGIRLGEISASEDERAEL